LRGVVQKENPNFVQGSVDSLIRLVRKSREVNIPYEEVTSSVKKQMDLKNISVQKIPQYSNIFKEIPSEILNKEILKLRAELINRDRIKEILICTEVQYPELASSLYSGLLYK